MKIRVVHRMSLISCPIFFVQVNVICENLKEFHELTRRTREIQRQREIVVIPSKRKSLLDEMNKLIAANMRLAKGMKDMIQKFDLQVRQKAVNTKKERMVEVKIQQNVCSFLKEKYQSLLTSYMELRNEIDAADCRRIERHFRIVFPDATPEEIEEVRNSRSEQVFADEIFAKQLGRKERRCMEPVVVRELSAGEATSLNDAQDTAKPQPRLSRFGSVRLSERFSRKKKFFTFGRNKAEDDSEGAEVPAAPPQILEDDEDIFANAVVHDE
eukprot:Rmarinus@m.21086